MARRSGKEQKDARPEEVVIGRAARPPHRVVA